MSTSISANCADTTTKKPWWVYIIESESGKFYTGISTDIKRRFSEHAGISSVAKGAKFFRGDPPKKIVYVESLLDRSAASKREASIKKLSRAKKIALIASANI